MLVLREYDPLTGRYSGRSDVVQITHIVKGHGNGFGLNDGFSMLSIVHLPADQERAVLARAAAQRKAPTS